MQDEWVAEWEAEHDHAADYDPNVVWYPHIVVNHRRMAEMWAADEWERAHEDKPWHDGNFTSWAAERDSKHPMHFRWGTAPTVSREQPADDDWFYEHTAKPDVLLVAEQVPGQRRAN